MSTRCQAPVRSAGGVQCCVSTREGCLEPSHRRWDRVAAIAALVWRIKPWWPNALGRAQDRGHAHTPLVQPCRYCRLLTSRGQPPAHVRRDHRAAEEAQR